MRVIELDGEDWVEDLDAIEALLRALEAPDWHGRNMNALVDSIAAGGINRVEPPYEVRIHGARHMLEGVRSFLDDLARHVGATIDTWPSRIGGRRKVRFVFLNDARAA